MRVLLVYPNLRGMNMLPPAIGLFSSLLKAHGHNVALFDSTSWVISGEDEFDSDKRKEELLNVRPFDDSKLRECDKQGSVFDSFEEIIESFRPQLLAVSVSEDLFPVAIRLLESVRHFQIPTILGGVFPTFAPEICLSREEVDMVCIGEGERVLVELCERMESGKRYDDLENLWLKTSSGIRRNEMGPPIDMDENPVLDLSLFEDSRLYRPMQGRVWRMLPAETHRGCPFKCTYCNSPSQQELYNAQTGQSYYRKKSFHAIHRELKHFKEVYGAEAFYFWADTFLSYTNREFDEFCEVYRDIDLPFWCQTRPETIQERRIRKLMDLGMFRMGIGVEHGNYEFRKNILLRKVTNERIIQNLLILNKCDLPFSVNNIIGFPTETRQLAMDTVELNRFIEADSYNAYSFAPFHGTPLRKMAEDMGYCEPGLIARSIMRPTLLNMPDFPPNAIEGLRRCFMFYVKMPKSRWAEITKAEALTPEGDALRKILRQEFKEKNLMWEN